MSDSVASGSPPPGAGHIFFCFVAVIVVVVLLISQWKSMAGSSSPARNIYIKNFFLSFFNSFYSLPLTKFMKKKKFLSSLKTVKILTKMPMQPPWKKSKMAATRSKFSSV